MAACDNILCALGKKFLQRFLLKISGKCKNFKNRDQKPKRVYTRIGPQSSVCTIKIPVIRDCVNDSSIMYYFYHVSKNLKPILIGCEFCETFTKMALVDMTNTVITDSKLLPLDGSFEEKCPTLTVGSFVRRARSTLLFTCSTT